MHFIVNHSDFRQSCFYILTWLSALSAPREPLHQFPPPAQMHLRLNCFDVMNYYHHKLVTAIFYLPAHFLCLVGCMWVIR